MLQGFCWPRGQASFSDLQGQALAGPSPLCGRGHPSGFPPETLQRCREVISADSANTSDLEKLSMVLRNNTKLSEICLLENHTADFSFFPQ